MRKFLFLSYLLLLSFPLSLSASNSSSAAKSGMVVSEQRLASQVGANILRAGGNAIDAAVAVGYALAVVNPCCGNIGGGGFMTIHLASGKDIFINFREKAPLRAKENMFLDANGNEIQNESTKGYLAVGVPGTVLGLATALKKYGTMTPQQVMNPAIQLAENGYKVTSTDAKWFADSAPDFRQQPNIAAIFLKQGKAYQAGDLLIQKDLAQTLKLIRDQGSDVFYKGQIAQAIVKASTENGGILSMDDFAAYNVEILTPIHCTYRGYNIISAPPPSSGGVTLCEMLNILEHFPLQTTGYHSAESAKDIIEAMRYAFIDRNSKLGDPDFDQNPIKQLLSKSYADAISEKIRATQSAPHNNIDIKDFEFTDTTHYSIIDKAGNAVAVTYTLNGFFGAKVIALNTGFFLNDEMDDFATKPGSANKFGLVQYGTNDIAQGKRPLSSMSPTIVMKNGKVIMVLGSPGGPRIITAVLLTLINVIDYGMNIADAVNAPRFHYQGSPDSVFIEPSAFRIFDLFKLKWMGYDISYQQPWSAVEAILIDPVTHTIYGANDYRRPDGASIGY